MADFEDKLREAIKKIFQIQKYWGVIFILLRTYTIN